MNSEMMNAYAAEAFANKVAGQMSSSSSTNHSSSQDVAAEQASKARVEELEEQQANATNQASSASEAKAKSQKSQRASLDKSSANNVSKATSSRDKAKPAQSKTAEEASVATETVEKADKSEHNYNDTYDYNPQIAIDAGRQALMEYEKAYQRDVHQHLVDNTENRKYRSKCLSKFINEWTTAMKKIWSAYNHSVADLQVQIKALKLANSGMKGVNVKGQLGIILQWARTGMPAKLDEDIQRFDKLAHDPSFIEYTKENHRNKPLSVPKPLVSRYDEEVGRMQARQNSEAAQAKTKKSGK